MTPNSAQAAPSQGETAAATSSGPHLHRVDSRMDMHPSVPYHIIPEQSDTGTMSLPQRKPPSSSKKGVVGSISAHRRPKDSATRSSRNSSIPHTNYYFSSVDPTAPVDKDELRRRRRHVMDVYNDRGAPSHSQRRMRRRRLPVPSIPGISSTSSVPSRSTSAAACRQSSSPLPQNNAINSNTSHSNGHNTHLDSLQRNATPPFVPTDTGVAIRRPLWFPPHTYLGASWLHLPFPLSTLGRELNPFDTWPDFTAEGINIDRYKYECSLRFRSRGLARDWVPALLQARHAFLSTICISAAHDEIMTNHMKPAHTRSQHQTEVRSIIRTGVLKMINIAISDPRLQYSDATIIAVLQMFTSEIMGDDTGYLFAHVKGLNDMIKQRGGLNQLGLSTVRYGSLIAVIIVVTMYLMSALHETVPDQQYRDFSNALLARIEVPKQTKPESPLFWTGNKPYERYRQLNKIPDAVRILDRLARLVRAFSRCSPSRQTSQDMVLLYGSIKAFPVSEAVERAFRFQHRYEPVRLTAILYGHAITQYMPLSIASQRLQEHGFGRASDEPPTTNTSPIFVQIRDALIKTDLDDLWGDMTGVLFWICLTAGAAARKSQSPIDTGDTSTDAHQANEARKFFCALAVRCTVSLSFDHPTEVLATLNNMFHIQRVIHDRYHNLPPPPLQPADGSQDQGPAQGPQEPVGFRDYAWEFLNLPPDPDLTLNPPSLLSNVNASARSDIPGFQLGSNLQPDPTIPPRPGFLFDSSNLPPT